MWLYPQLAICLIDIFTHSEATVIDKKLSDFYFQGIVGHGYYAVGGSVLVLVSVIGMALSDWLEEKLSCKTRDPEADNSQSLEEEKTSKKLGHDEDLEENSVALLTNKK